jgi:hypothetical protein
MESRKGDKMVINGKKYEIVSEFPVFYQGWECDYTGYVIKAKDSNKIEIALTSHGRAYIAKDSELTGYIEEYQNAIDKMKNAIALKRGKDA